MAVTKLLRIKERKSGDPSGGLKAALKYICNPEKAALIGGNAGTDPDRAYSVMKRNKDYWNKPGGSAGFHYVISFPPDCPVDVKTIASVAEDFSQELLGGRYYFTYAVHTDKDHVHVHIVFDSVAIDDGVKYHSPKGDWEKRIQPISDRVCQKYGLPPLEYDGTKKSVDYGEWIQRRQKEKYAEDHPGLDQEELKGKWQSGHPYINHWFDLIRDDIDEAILRSPSYSDFLKYLESLEYSVRDGKYLSLKPKGRGRAVRTIRLGKGYSKEEIRQRIEYVRMHPVSENSFRSYGDMETVRRLLFVRKQKNGRWHMNEFQRTFYRRWRNTCFIRKPDLRGRRGSRTIVLSLEELSDNLQFLIREDIRSQDELDRRREDLGNERKAVRSELSSVKTRLYRSDICRLVSRREKLMEKFWLSPQEEEELSRIDKEIEKIMPVQKAVRYRDSLLDQKASCLSQMRDLRERDRLLRNIGWQFEDEGSGEIDRGDYREVLREREEKLKREAAEMSRAARTEAKSRGSEKSEAEEKSQEKRRKTDGRER